MESSSKTNHETFHRRTSQSLKGKVMLSGHKLLTGTRLFFRASVTCW